VPDLTEDLVRGSSLTEDDNGLMLVRNYLITDIDPNTYALVTAYEDTAGIPDYGDPDDDFPELVCRNLAFRPYMDSSRSAVRLAVTFKPPDFSSATSPVIRFTAITREVESEFAPDGTPLRITYTPTGGTAAEVFTPRRRDQKKLGLLEIDQVENDVPTQALSFIGKINSDSFQGQPAFTWQIRNIAFEKEIYRAEYRVHYEIEYDPELHIDTLAYRRAFDNRVPPDIQTPIVKTVAAGNGWINVRRGPATAFSPLSLPNVFI
jgi:hypothetical protein